MSLLLRLARAGDIGWLAYYFAGFIARRGCGSIDDPPALAAALVAEANLAGDVCVDLEDYRDRPPFASSNDFSDELPQRIDPPGWQAALRAHPAVGEPGADAPLVLDGHRLYLQRFWYYESRVAARLGALLDAPAGDDGTLHERVAALFAGSGAEEADQRRAVLLTASRQLAIISGGPGTGKTTTVLRLLATLLAADAGLRVALSAPTGKAAARMLDSIRKRGSQLDLGAAVHDALPEQAGTLHRLLGYRHREFRYTAEHPLPFDCVIVDEASMIDLELMHRLLDALPAGARLILLGDRDQLAAVAAGNVLGDITGHGLDPQTADAPIASAIALLRHSFRFDAASGIGALATAINRGDADGLRALLASDAPGLAWHAAAGEELAATAFADQCDRYQAIFDAAEPDAALAAFARSRVLCATNHGPLGVEALNRQFSATLQRRNRITADEYFRGLPIMLTRNRHDLELYNGDTGILWPRPGGLRACFPGGAGLREFSLNRLPEFTPAWATTVHKAQGSEFDSVLLVLPNDAAAEVLSRELLYTAVTRARREFALQAPATVVEAAVRRLTRRTSGLAERLGWPAPGDAGGA